MTTTTDPDPDSDSRPPRPARAQITLDASADYRRWLGRFARAERRNLSSLIDGALAELARVRGFEAPPAR